MCIVIGALMSLGSCSSIYQTGGFPGRDSPPLSGVPYYLPRGVVPVTVSTDVVTKDKTRLYTVDMTIGAPQLVADGTAKYFLKTTTNLFYTDNTKVAVNAGGLLQTSSYKSDDQTGAVIAKLAQLAELVAGVPTGPPTFIELVEANKVCKLKKMSFAFFVDNEHTNGPPELDQAGFKFEASGFPSSSGANELKPPIDGIVFRSPKPSTIKFKLTPKPRLAPCGLRSEVKEMVLTLPDPGSTFTEAAARKAFSRREADYTIVDGMLLGVEVKQPSQALGLVSIPVDVAKAIVSIPGQLLTVKVNQANANKQISDAELQILKDVVAARAEQNKLNPNARPY